MTTSAVARYLERAALDADFADLCRRSPDESFAGFDLDDDERDMLRRRDPDLLTLIGRVLTESGVTARPAADEVTVGDDAAAAAGEQMQPPETVSLPEIALVVRVQPQATRRGAGWDVTYTAALQPVQTDAPPPAPQPAGTRDVERAAAAVRTASGDERRQRLLDLLAALSSP